MYASLTNILFDFVWFWVTKMRYLDIFLGQIDFFVNRRMHVSVVHSFSLPHSILLCEYTIFFPVDRSGAWTFWNISSHICARIPLGCIPRSWVPGSLNMCLFNSTIWCQIDFFLKFYLFCFWQCWLFVATQALH